MSKLTNELFRDPSTMRASRVVYSRWRFRRIVEIFAALGLAFGSAEGSSVQIEPVSMLKTLREPKHLGCLARIELHVLNPR